MDKALLKEVVLEQKQAQEGFDLGIKRIRLDAIEKLIALPHTVVISGMRRVGKSTFLAQIIGNYFKEGVYYFNFEDERLVEFTTADFNNLYELLLELEGEKKIFFFDEIQNVQKWELFVRRMQDRGHKFFITGSNASLLSKELGTRLTGRCAMLELYPFSFEEFLRFNGVEFNEEMFLYTEKRGELKRYFGEYLKTGGMPEYLKYQDASLLKRVYED
ncbi:MAG: AAA family ATPase, partial [Candidatus Omnitrophota bacterium]